MGSVRNALAYKGGVTTSSDNKDMGTVTQKSSACASAKRVLLYPGGISWRTLGAALAGKLILMPAIAVALLHAFDATNALGPASRDPIFKLTLLLHSATPSAINLSVIAASHAHNEEKISTILLFSYMCGIVTVTIFLAWFLSIIQVI